MKSVRKSGKNLRSERALRELRARILSGEFPADSHVSETAAAEMIGISRTPAREAMAQLVEEGLLERASSGRCTVRALTRADIVDAIEVRGVLEGTVVRVAAERGAVPEVMERCKDIAARIDKALGGSEPEIDFDRYADLNASFHDQLARLSGSPTLEREVRRAYRLPLASPSAFLQSQASVALVRRSLYHAQRQHCAILDAVARREGGRAEALAREHARMAWDNLDGLLNADARITRDIPGLSLVSDRRARPGNS